MAGRRASPAAVRSWVRAASLTDSGRTGGVIAKVKTIVEYRQIDARTGVHLMVAIGLWVTVDKVLSHFYSPRFLVDWASTEPARVLVVALYLSLSRT